MSNEYGYGDRLARGQKSATFTSNTGSKGVSTNDPQIREDLQTLTEDQFLEKYFEQGVGAIEYRWLIKSLSDETEPNEQVEDSNSAVQVQQQQTTQPMLIGTPVNDNILILPDEESNSTQGGIVIPENAKRKINRGRVVAVGLGWRDRQTGVLYPCSVKEGDYILFNEFAAHGKEVELGGQRLLLITDMDVLLVLTKVTV